MPVSDRVKTHIRILRAPALVALSLACVPWKTPVQRMRGAGLGDAPRARREEIAKIISGDGILRARRCAGRDRALRIRCVTTPDKPR